MTDALGVVVLTLGLLLVGTAVLLVFLRTRQDRLEERQRRQRDSVRQILFAIVMADDAAEAVQAREELEAREGDAWEVAEDQIFTMLPKLKGDVRLTLVSVLEAKGAAQRAGRLTSSWSAVRRCRGAYRLGVLGSPEHAETLLPLLEDRNFLVRRVGVRALGLIGDPVSVPMLLRAGSREPQLTRDLVAALDRIGSDGAEELQNSLSYSLAPDADEHLVREGELAATGLGLVGDVSSIPLLAQAIESPQHSLRVAAADALGRIGASDAVAVLSRSLRHSDAMVRVSAAQALGSIGDVDAVPALGLALAGQDHETSRAVAQALLRCGEPGMHELEHRDSVYAVEAMALHRIRAGA